MLGLLLLLLAPTVASAEAWYLVEFAANKPLCETSTTNCWETDSRRSGFEMRDGETLTMPTAADLPPAWVAMREIWVYAPSIAEPAFELTLDRTPSGVRLQMNDGHLRYLQTLPLDEWVRVDGGKSRRLWARVSSVDGSF